MDTIRKLPGRLKADVPAPGSVPSLLAGCRTHLLLFDHRYDGMENYELASALTPVTAAALDKYARAWQSPQMAPIGITQLSIAPEEMDDELIVALQSLPALNFLRLAIPGGDSKNEAPTVALHTLAHLRQLAIEDVPDDARITLPLACRVSVPVNGRFVVQFHDGKAPVCQARYEEGMHVATTDGGGAVLSGLKLSLAHVYMSFPVSSGLTQWTLDQSYDWLTSRVDTKTRNLDLGEMSETALNLVQHMDSQAWAALNEWTATHCDGGILTVQLPAGTVLSPPALAALSGLKELGAVCAPGTHTADLSALLGNNNRPIPVEVADLQPGVTIDLPMGAGLSFSGEPCSGNATLRWHYPDHGVYDEVSYLGYKKLLETGEAGTPYWASPPRRHPVAPTPLHLGEPSPTLMPLPDAPSPSVLGKRKRAGGGD